MSRGQMLLSIIIPVFNEELTIGNIIDRVKASAERTGLNVEIIVVDDHSHDRSLDIAKQHCTKLLSLKQHMGKGSALRAGFARAKGDIVVTIDSDGSHLPEELAEVLEPVLQDRADMVIGSRFKNHKKVDARSLNAFGVRLFNRCIMLLTGVTITDSQSGYRAIRREALKNQRLRSFTYEIESEMLVKTAKKHFRVVEVPISFEQRTYGRSGVDPLVDGFKILVSIASAYVRS
jgi:glycosyltransferase involved in cell wall biosynthesis